MINPYQWPYATCWMVSLSPAYNIFTMLKGNKSPSSTVFLIQCISLYYKPTFYEHRKIMCSSYFTSDVIQVITTWGKPEENVTYCKLVWTKLSIDSNHTSHNINVISILAVLSYIYKFTPCRAFHAAKCNWNTF